jgi:hypothetical protein
VGAALVCVCERIAAAGWSWLAASRWACGAFFFWFPAVSLTDLIRTEELVRGRFDFHGQFPGFSAVFGYSRFYATGLLTPLILAVGIALAARGAWIGRRKSGESQLVLVAALIAAAGFLALLAPSSSAIWERVPFLPLFQFPWRMLGPLALLCALVSACAVARLLAGRGARQRVLAELVLGPPRSMRARAECPAASPAISALPAIRSGIIREDGRSPSRRVSSRAADPEAWRRASTRGPAVSARGRRKDRGGRDLGTRIRLGSTRPRTVAAGGALGVPGWVTRSMASREHSGNEAGSLTRGALQTPPPRPAARAALAAAGRVAVSAAALLLWPVLVLRWPWRLGRAPRSDGRARGGSRGGARSAARLRSDARSRRAALTARRGGARPRAGARRAAAPSSART